MLQLDFRNFLENIENTDNELIKRLKTVIHEPMEYIDSFGDSLKEGVHKIMTMLKKNIVTSQPLLGIPGKIVDSNTKNIEGVDFSMLELKLTNRPFIIGFEREYMNWKSEMPYEELFNNEIRRYLVSLPKFFFCIIDAEHFDLDQKLYNFGKRFVTRGCLKIVNDDHFLYFKTSNGWKEHSKDGIRDVDNIKGHKNIELAFFAEDKIIHRLNA